MKRIFTLLIILVLIGLQKSNAQRIEYDRTSPWFIGANIGYAWQTTDVKNQGNYGWGLVLGRTYNRQPGRVLSYDFKFRYLGGAWRGQDHFITNFGDFSSPALENNGTDYKTNTGFVVQNFQTKSHEFNLELSLHFNRFTERTGWDPYLLVGAGLSFYHAKANALNSNWNMYQYNDSTKYTAGALSDILDNDYETSLFQNTVGKAAFMGHLGFGLGYYVSRNVALGFEHKTTFTGVDNFDGILTSNIRAKNDIYHYTNLYLKIYFNRARLNTHQEPKPTVNNPVNPPVAPPVAPCNPPVINLRTANSITVNNPLFTVQGTAINVYENIRATQNGMQAGNFSFNNRGEFSSNFQLQPGLNTIVLDAANSCGTASQTIHVNYVPACDAPIVQFTNPRTNSISSNTNNYQVQATIQHLNQGLIQVYVNGQLTNNYSHNAATGILTSNVNLQNGNNTVQIVASNNCGNSSQSVSISYTAYCPTPTIAITAPTTTVGTSQRMELVSTITGISAASQVDIFVNGVAQTAGSYVANTNRFSKLISLQTGNNTIVVRATNNCGSAEQTITYQVSEPCFQPTVAFSNPSGPRTSTSNLNYTVQATIANIIDPHNITFKVNNQVINNFHFNVQTGLFTANINLSQGSNSIELYVQNACGYATTSAVVTFTPPCEVPTATWRNPSTNSTTVTSNIYSIEALIGEINSALEVTVLVNGVEQSAGTYNANTDLFRKELQLQEGNNFIQLKVKNLCGEKTISTNIIYKKKQVVTGTKPTITFANNCNTTVQAGIVTFTGTIIGTTSKESIQFIAQNVPLTNVNLTSIQNGFTFEYTVRVAYSTTYSLQITASNIYGTTTQTCQITTEGAPIVDNDITICHRINGINQTITIKESQWEKYKAQGATMGACPIVDNDLTICLTQNGKQITMTIKESQWDVHAAQGATKGPCPIIDRDIEICFPKGAQNVTMIIKESQWDTYKAQGAKLGKCPIVDNDIEICVVEGRIRVTKIIKESQWPTYQAQGAKLGKCPEPVDLDIEVCVLEGKVRVTKVIKESQWAHYESLGATLGKCPLIDNDIQICVTENGVRVNKTIKESQWEAYKAKGATLGKCPIDRMITICVNENGTKVNKTVKESEWPTYQAQGATMGACPIEKYIVICLQEGKNFVTKTIKESEWSMYQKMGATLGKCKEIVDNEIVICTLEGRQRVTKKIRESQWPDYQKMGATLGACPEVIDNDIEICVTEGRISVTRTIKESQWPTYQAMGATLGACTTFDPEIPICVRQGNQLVNMTIKESQWPTYQAQGAIIGSCPEIIDADITICVTEANGTRSTRVIKQSQWEAYKAKGAVLGACTTLTTNKEMPTGQLNIGQMLICVMENGKQVTKTINALEWKKWEVKGAVKGACDNNDDEGTDEKPKPKPVVPGSRPTTTRPLGTVRTETTSPQGTTTQPAGTGRTTQPATSPSSTGRQPSARP